MNSNNTLLEFLTEWNNIGFSKPIAGRCLADPSGMPTNIEFYIDMRHMLGSIFFKQLEEKTLQISPVGGIAYLGNFSTNEFLDTMEEASIKVEAPRYKRYRLYVAEGCEDVELVNKKIKELIKLIKDSKWK